MFYREGREDRGSKRVVQAGYLQTGRKGVWLTLAMVAIDDVVVSARACGSAGPAREA